MTSETRMILKAYVCGANCVRWQDFEGSSTFRDIYIRRPSDCRYAIVETTHDGVQAIDLYDTRIVEDGTHVPGNITTYRSLDAAIMATTLGYDNG